MRLKVEVESPLSALCTAVNLTPAETFPSCGKRLADLVEFSQLVKITPISIFGRTYIGMAPAAGPHFSDKRLANLVEFSQQVIFTPANAKTTFVDIFKSVPYMALEIEILVERSRL